MTEEDITRETPLTFEITLVDGSKLTTVGDAEAYFLHLRDDQRQNSHWGIAVRMFTNAMHEAAYLKAATMSLQTALVLDGLAYWMRS